MQVVVLFRKVIILANICLKQIYLWSRYIKLCKKKYKTQEINKLNP